MVNELKGLLFFAFDWMNDTTWFLKKEISIIVKFELENTLKNIKKYKWIESIS